MSWSVTLAGETFTDANVAGIAYADEETGFPAILAAFAREAAFLKGLAATSATMLTPAVGSAVLTTHQDAATVGLSPGMLVRVASAGDPSRVMVASVTGFTGTALSLDVLFASGAAAADWVVTRPGGGTNLVLDPSPTLGADLDADGRSVLGAADGSFSGDLTVAGTASFGTAGQTKVGYLGEVSGDVPVRPTDPTTLVCTIVGDTTFLVAGAGTPGYEHAHKIRATIGGAGGWTVNVLPASWMTNGNDMSDTLIDSGWIPGGVTAVQDVTTPAGPGWTLTATTSGNGYHYCTARRTPVSAAPFDYVASALVKAGTSSRIKVTLVLDTYAHGGWVDVDLAAGTITATGTSSMGTLLDYGIRPAGDGWYLVWLAVDVVVAGLQLNTTINVLNAAGAVSYTQAGESVLFGGATLGGGANFLGFQHIGAARSQTVLWQGVPIGWPSLTAGQAVDLMIQCEPDRIIQQDYTPEEI